MGFVNEFKRWARGEDIDEEFEDFIPEPLERKNDYTHNDYFEKEEGTSYPTELRRDKIVNIHATTQLSVVLVKPDKFENAAEIADHLKDKRTVVLNLENTCIDAKWIRKPLGEP